jgi:hypothetical protein
MCNYRNMEYSIINGKKYKKCNEGQIRNPLTKRCNKIKVPLNKQNKDISLNEKAKKIQKIFLPFIKRVSANIEDRIRYYLLLKKFLKININLNKQCINIYKINNDKPIYQIGNNIILKEKIGSESAHGIVYLATFMNRTRRLFKYACKIVIINPNILLDLEIQKKLSKAINRCPHFYLLYNYFKCTNINFKNIKLYPPLIKKAKKEKKELLISFLELANGDLNIFLKNSKYDNTLLLNALGQIFISLLFYYSIIKKKHNDAHGGNFLFHKIKKGGFFHYKLFDNDYYLENLGYLWLIHDFEKSTPLNNNYINSDFNYVFYSLLPPVYGGWNKYSNYKNKRIKLILEDVKQIYNEFRQLNKNNLFQELIKLLTKYNILSTKIDNKSTIINKMPYIL